MATLKEAIEYAKMNPNTAFATALRSKIESGEADEQAAKEGIQLPGRQTTPSFLDKVKQEANILSSRYQRNVGEAEARQARGQQTGLETAAQTFGEAARAGVGTLLSPLTVGIGEAIKATGITESAQEKAKATEEYIAQQKAVNSNYNPETDPKLNPFTAGVVQSAQSSPYQERQLSEREKANLGIVTNVGGAAMDVAGTIEGVGLLKNAAVGTGKALATGAKQTASAVANAPIVSGTGQVLKSAGRTLKTIPENIATNVGEMQAKEAAIKSIPSVAGQEAVKKGIDIADATTLSKVIKTPESKKLIEAVKAYAADKSKPSPFEIVGKPIVERLQKVDKEIKTLAGQLDTTAQELKGLSIADVSKIESTVLDSLNKLQVKATSKGLDFTDSVLEGIGGSGKLLDNVYKRIAKSKDAFDLHNLKKYIDSNVSYGKRLEGLDANAEGVLKSWRKAIDDTLDAQFPEYNAINTKLTQRISPLEDLKSLLKNVDGLDTDLLSQKAGIIARRITSAAASNPEIKQILRNLDSFTKIKGKTLGSIENLQELYNVLNKYYDIAPKTGFQNLVREGVAGGKGVIEEVTGAIKGFAGETNATRQKALENYLEELLAKTSKAKK